jgi:hypothetical protein
MKVAGAESRVKSQFLSSIFGIEFYIPGTFLLINIVARWFIFRPKMPIWLFLGGP